MNKQQNDSRLIHRLKTVTEENKFAEEELGRYDDDLMLARKEIKEYRAELSRLLIAYGSETTKELLDKYPPVI